MRLFVALSGLAALASLVQAQVRITQTYTPPPAASGTVPSPGGQPVNRQWANLLGSSLYFYDEQRAGNLPNNFRVPWRNDSVLDDGASVNLNLSGGWFDAGNFIKHTFPLSWTLTQVAWAGATYGAAFDGADQTPYLDCMLRHGLDWLLEASRTDGQLVVMVGGLEDNYWGGDRTIPTPRAVYTLNQDDPGTDVFASAATALALGSLLYSGVALPLTLTTNGSAAGLRDDAYAATLLQRSERLLDLARKYKQQVYQKSVAYPAKAYPSTDFLDELCLSSTFLAMATGNASYVDFALQSYQQARYPFGNGALNWDQHAPAVPVALLQLAVVRPGLSAALNATRMQSDAEVWLDGLVNKDMPSTSVTPGGLTYFKGDSDAGSLNPAMNAAVLALQYAGLASSMSKGTAYTNWANKQVDYMLGSNPMNAVYVVGASPNSAQNPHSSLASGGNSVATIDTVPQVETYVLYGAVVGGPDKDDQYYDERSDYTQTEPAIDTVSPLVAIAAAQIAAGAGDPFFVTLTQPREMPVRSSSSGGGLSQGAKIAIAVIVLVVVFGGALAIAIWKRDALRSWFRHRRMGLK